MIDPEEYRDLVEENTMLRKELKAAKEENTRLLEGVPPNTVASAYAMPFDGEPTEFDLHLISYSAENRVKLVKLIRAELGIMLGDAIKLVSQLPQILLEGRCRNDVNELRTKIEALGGVVEVYNA